METNIEGLNFTAPISSPTKKVRREFDKVALIDADYLKYYVTLDVYKYIEKEGDVVANMGPMYLKHFVTKRLEDIFESFSAKGYIFCFSGNRKKTYRYFLAVEKEYKGTRQSGSQYEYENVYEDMAAIMSIIKEDHPVVIFPDLEADDILSALQNDDTFIYSHDKDMKQVPGLHFNFTSRNLDSITSLQGFESLCMQMLTGDSSDNISGLPGCGIKTARKIMLEYPGKQLLSRIWFLYKQKYGIIEGTDRFTECWQLLKLRSYRGDWFKEKIASAIDLRDKIININI